MSLQEPGIGASDTSFGAVRLQIASPMLQVKVRQVVDWWPASTPYFDNVLVEHGIVVHQL